MAIGGDRSDVFKRSGIAMEMVLRFFGYVGTVLLLFGVLGAVIVGSFLEQPLIVLHLVLGTLCLLAWGVTSGLANISEASAVISGRRARFGYNAALYTAVFLGLLIVVNVYVSINDKRWDLTEQGLYSLSEKSVKIVAALAQPIKIIAIDAPQSQDKEQTRALLNLYHYQNDKLFSFDIIDPSARPLEVDSLGMKQGNLLYIEYGDGVSKGVSRINTVDEQSITNAIIKLTRGAAKKFYYVQGHGEPNIQSQAQGGMKEFADGLVDEHIIIEGLLLAQTGSVPSDAAAVILAAPKKALQEGERAALIEYGQKGGRLVLLANAEDRDSDDVRIIAKAFGIEVGRDVILDEQLRLFAGPQLGVQFVAQSFSPHLITGRLNQTEPPVFAFASSVLASSSKTPGVTYTELLKSGPKSWGERNLEDLLNPNSATAIRDPEDLKGPVSLAVAMEKKLSKQSQDKESSFVPEVRVVVFGDTTWLENGNFNLYGNRDLALNVVNWVAGEEGGVAIGPKSIRASSSPFSQATYSVILALSFIGPELLLLFGLFIWWRRRVALV